MRVCGAVDMEFSLSATTSSHVVHVEPTARSNKYKTHEVCALHPLLRCRCCEMSEAMWMCVCCAVCVQRHGAYAAGSCVGQSQRLA